MKKYYCKEKHVITHISYDGKPIDGMYHYDCEVIYDKHLKDIQIKSQYVKHFT